MGVSRRAKPNREGAHLGLDRFLIIRGPRARAGPASGEIQAAGMMQFTHLRRLHG
jgi:hypothetical protein